MISLIVPVYNVEAYLEECLESIELQSYRDIEVVLINDGSTDSSGEICEKWVKRDHRFKLVAQVNAGLSSARNTGLQHITGEYVAFVDSDDILSKDFCTTMLNAINCEQSCDVVACGITKFIDPNISNSFSYFSYCNKVVEVRDFWKSILRHESDNAVWGKLFKKEILNDNKFREGILNEDLIFFHDLTPRLKSVRYIDKSLYFYRIRHGSITNRVSPKISDFYYNALEVRDTILKKYEWQLGHESIGFVFTEITNIIATIEKYDSRESFSSLYKEMFSFMKKFPLDFFINRYWSLQKKFKFLLLVMLPGIYRSLLQYKRRG